MQSLEDSQVFIDLLRTHQHLKCSEDDHLQTGTNGNQWRSVIGGISPFFKIMVAEHVAFITAGQV